MAQPQTLASALHPGTVLDGRYRVGERLGAGGMGSVYRGEHLGIGRAVAIKVLHRDVAGDEKRVARFALEARAAAAIRHPGIVEVLDSGTTTDGVPYLVMELLEGETLADRLERGPLDPGAAVALAAELLDALGAAHERGIVHRDLKPENIFLACAPTPRTKIVDFGISKFIDGTGALRLTATGQVLGTPLYMAPEQARGVQAIGPAMDLYSLGAVLYRMLVGRPPYGGDTYAEVVSRLVADSHPPACEVDPAVPRPLSNVIDWLLAKSPAARPASALAAKAALVRALAGNTDGVMATVEEGAPESPPPSPERRRTPLRPALIALGVVVIGVVIALAIRAHRTPAAPATPPRPTVAAPAPAASPVPSPPAPRPAAAPAPVPPPPAATPRKPPRPHPPLHPMPRVEDDSIVPIE